MAPSSYVVLLAMALLPFGGPTLASAQPASDAAEQSAAARALFQQGVQHADRQEWNDAADRFRRAMALRPSPVIAYNLGAALVHTGRLVEATEHLRFAVRAEDVNRNVRNSAQRLLDELQPRLATLTVRLAGHPEGVEVRLDGEAMSAAVIGVGAPADPGRHRVSAHRGGAEVAGEDVELTDGSSREVTLDIPAPPVVPDPADVEADGGGGRDGPPIVPDPDRGPRDTGDDEGGSVLGQWWFWAIVGVAVAGGVVATLLLTAPADPDPVQGSFMPGVLEVP